MYFPRHNLSTDGYLRLFGVDCSAVQFHGMRSLRRVILRSATRASYALGLSVIPLHCTSWVGRSGKFPSTADFRATGGRTKTQTKAARSPPARANTRACRLTASSSPPAPPPAPPRNSRSWKSVSADVSRNTHDTNFAPIGSLVDVLDGRSGLNQGSQSLVGAVILHEACAYRHRQCLWIR